jgi:hypothetical protein
VVIGNQRRTKSLFRPVTFDVWDGQSAITGCAIVHFRVLRELAELDRTIQRLATPFGSEWTERYCGLTEQNPAGVKLSSPIRIKIHRLMKSPAPSTALSDVLDQRWGMVKDLTVKPACQSADSYILHPSYCVPIVNYVL